MGRKVRVNPERLAVRGARVDVQEYAMEGWGTMNDGYHMFIGTMCHTGVLLGYGYKIKCVVRVCIDSVWMWIGC